MEIGATRPRRRGEAVFGLLLLVLAIGLFWQSYAIAGFSALSSPGAFPLAASGTMVLAAAIVVVGDLRARSREADRTPILPANVAVFAVLLALYALAIEPLGFLPASLAFLFVGTKLLYRGGWVASALVSIGALIVIYVLFRIVFQVVLPEGIVPEGEWLAATRRLLGGAE